MNEDKLYVLVRRDLPWSVRTVQSIHAATKLVIENPSVLAPKWGQYGPAVVVLGVENELGLEGWWNKLDGVTAGFCEPDMDDELTAVAYYGQSPLLSGLSLL